LLAERAGVRPRIERLAVREHYAKRRLHADINHAVDPISSTENVLGQQDSVNGSRGVQIAGAQQS